MIANKLGRDVLSTFSCQQDDPSSTDPIQLSLTLMSDLCRISGAYCEELQSCFKRHGQPGSYTGDICETYISGLLRRIEPIADKLVVIFYFEAGLELHDSLKNLLLTWHLKFPDYIHFIFGATPESPFTDVIDGMHPKYIPIPRIPLQRELFNYAVDCLEYCDVFSTEKVAAKLASLSEFSFVSVILAGVYLQLQTSTITLPMLDALTPSHNQGVSK
ncbi:hypothetical protein HK405_007798, partial [Cladochytrium tenue]